MTVWLVTTKGNEVLGVFVDNSTARASINYSYHKRHVRIEVRQNKPDRYNDDILEVYEDDKLIDTVRVYEEPVHSSTIHL